jgi:Zn-dependent M28 family amino/carboxypeptidase
MRVAPLTEATMVRTSLAALILFCLPLVRGSATDDTTADGERWWSGEEKGMLGSRYFAEYPTVQAKSIVANLNLDMFLPLFPFKIVMAQGLEESDLGDHLHIVARDAAVQVQADPEPDRNRFIRSDQYSFIRRGVPALAFKFGYEKGSQEEKIHKEWTKKRYHAPSDDLTQPVDREAAARFNRLLLALVERVGNQPERPRWKPDSFFRRFAE